MSRHVYGEKHRHGGFVSFSTASRVQSTQEEWYSTNISANFVL